MGRPRPTQHGALRKAFQSPKSCAASNGSLPGSSNGFCWAAHQYEPEGPEKPGDQKPQAPAKQPARSPIAGGLLGGLRAGRYNLSASANRSARGVGIYTNIFLREAIARRHARIKTWGAGFAALLLQIEGKQRQSLLKINVPHS
jgi:hypothetical protein